MITLLLAQACTINSTEKAFSLAEKLWQNGNYRAAATEFEKVYRDYSEEKLGAEALFRAAMTETLFLNQHREAIEKFNEYIEKGPDDRKWQAWKEIGEIYFSRLKDYNLAFEFYGRFCEEIEKNPDAVKIMSQGECLFRQAKSLFFLRRFKEAEVKFQAIEDKFKDSPWAEKAHFERAYTLYDGAEQIEDPTQSTQEYKRASKVFEAFLKKYPESSKRAEIQFGIALCFEELDQVDEALKTFAEIKDRYPSPEVVQIKIDKLRTRMQRQHQGI